MAGYRIEVIATTAEAKRYGVAGHYPTLEAAHRASILLCSVKGDAHHIIRQANGSALNDTDIAMLSDYDWCQPHWEAIGREYVRAVL